jgi:hypothetical protein
MLLYALVYPLDFRWRTLPNIARIPLHLYPINQAIFTIILSKIALGYDS